MRDLCDMKLCERGAGATTPRQMHPVLLLGGVIVEMSIYQGCEAPKVSVVPS